MKKAKALLPWVGILVTVIIGIIALTASVAVAAVNRTSELPQVRADIVRIDSLSIFGGLERPAVTFLHGKHTEALQKKNKDCATCHLSENNRMSLQYKRLKDTSRKEVMDIYHVNCIACHRETRAAKEPSGPVECGGCHDDRPNVTSNWKPIGMDKSLHYRHSKSQDEKCERCHHEYDEAAKKLVYTKGSEGTCRYCHKAQAEKNIMSLQSASHTACISCHQKNLTQNESAGPIYCQGCHDPGQQKLIEVIKDVPRMKMNQPDMVFVKTGLKEAHFPNPIKRMNPVPFNHKAHERYNNTCRVCHHADLNACARCHTIPGSKQGDFVKLEQAMHRSTTETSCIGCHRFQQRSPDCAGCHTGIALTSAQDLSGCLSCHMEPPSGVTVKSMRPDDTELAARMLASRRIKSEAYNDEEIPKVVNITFLSNRYEAVKLPHRKIVNTLIDNMKDNKLAGYFHRQQETICQGCHHNSPATRTPPKCASCHGQPFNEKDPFKPGLMAAYHRQCMECHSRMGIAEPVATNCTACHREKY